MRDEILRANANVLVTAAGTIVAQGIMKSLRLANSMPDNPVKYTIVAADASSEAKGQYRSDFGVVVPVASSREYIDSIISICEDQKIRAIFVGSEEELAVLSQANRRIHDETGAIVIANPPEVISISQDKWRTFEFLKRNNIQRAESPLVEDQDRFIRESGFPWVVKPRECHGSLHMYIAKSHDDIKNAILEIERAGWNPISQESLPAQD